MVPGIENEIDTLYELFGALDETELMDTSKYRAALKQIEKQFKKQDEIIEELESSIQEKDREIDSLRRGFEG